MSDLWFNIRIGKRHLQITRWLRGISFRKNKHLTDDDSKFVVFAAFGINF